MGILIVPVCCETSVGITKVPTVLSSVLSGVYSTIPSGLFTPSDFDYLIQKVHRLHILNHPNVMVLTGVCLDSDDGPAVVMPFMDHGSLLRYLQKETGKLLPPDDADCRVV